MLGATTAERRVVLVVVSVAWIVCLALALTRSVQPDEHMYLTAAHLEGRLYEDYAFLQPPYSAWVYATVDRLVPGSHILLPARVFSAAVAAGLLAAFFVLLRRCGAGALLAALLVLLLVHDAFVRITIGLARNYDLAQLAIVTALLLLPLAGAEPVRRGRLVLAGALAGVAIGMKLTYAPLALLVIAWPLVAPAGTGWARRMVVWTSAGLVLGLLPMGIAFVGVDPETIRFNLLDYHLLNARYCDLEGIGRGLTLAAKFQDAQRLYRYGDHAVLIGLGVVAAVIGLIPKARAGKAAVRLALLWLAAALVILLVPRPTHDSYYAPLLLGFLLLVAAAAGGASRLRTRMLQGAAVLACCVAVGHHLPADVRMMRQLADPGSWAGVQVHRAGRELAELVGDTTAPVTTVSSLYALEGGLRIHPELAAGRFTLRLNDLVDEPDQDRFRVVTSTDLPRLLMGRRPAAVLAGTRDRFAGPLTEWAAKQGWQPTAIDGGRIEVWLPPDGVSAAPGNAP